MKDLDLEAYCESVENEFFRQKARPGMLSPADFARTKEWFEAGIPVSLVHEAIADAFTAQSASRGRHDEEVNSLAFVESFVKRAIARRHAN